MGKFKKAIKNVRIIILIVFVVLALIAIHPNPWAKGLAIRTVAKDSSASIAGIESPTAGIKPMSRERILNINNIPVNSLKEYYDFVNKLDINRTFTLKTTKSLYRLEVLPEYKITYLNETETQTIVEQVFNETTNETINVTKTIEVPKFEKEIIGVADIGLGLYKAPTTNIKQGLDLSGGSRVVLRPEEEVSEEDFSFVIETIKQRLNTYGLSDIIVKPTSDLAGNDFIIVEIAGATKEEIRDLVANQGKFEAQIANQTVFIGGRDITYVCRSPDCSGIDPNVGCNPIQGQEEQWACRFRFSIALTPDAAQKQADVTETLEIVLDEQGNDYLSEKLLLLLDDEIVDELSIGSELKGNPQTDISISGSGAGPSQQAAMADALEQMKKLQTILVTGSLPVKLEIVKTDTISPILGEEFIKNAILVGIVAILAVAIVVFIRYRKLVVSIPMVINMVSEAIIILGAASLIGWNLDLAAIAGIIIAIGTGVDHQIVITDETLMSEKSKYTGWKDKLKKAFFIIIAAYLTTVVAMLPLYRTGAGLLKGFAVTTIIGVTIGVLITRPAFASIIEIFTQE
ncbi:MAG: hypothetical protein KKF46_04560 [Nanoarchaeota archaeon]|nr:hypothetical protein [Nanoarchaeota archaeon]MBU1321609.1 hypothetical protein [Nanoarchaeota archaeon]MBU1597996.1 hypothetical protein [Nanoarchaeota archaeon]MBU2440947.1 hypothetical protein [Nanoarchaeota archaeon]